MRVRTLAAFAAGVVVAASGTALATTKVAAIVGPDNKINGCYLTSAGLLRVVPAGTACADRETTIAWSATGSGERGPAGPAGPAGRKGEPGLRGPQGLRGAVGPAGTISGYQVVERSVFQSASPNASQVMEILCPAGKRAVGGGSYQFRTYPAGDLPIGNDVTGVIPGSGWQFRWSWQQASGGLLQGRVVCVDV